MPALTIPDEFKPAESAALRALLNEPEHARALRKHMERCATPGAELRLAWTYRAALRGERGAWRAWAGLCRSLNTPGG